ncbi:hypothetical protein AA313_de0209428 [Arthrobotrys entomopaga]|nr:hypothetical protein AA313_de0209428 [Arthrobotrys entomopaga]
MSMVSNANEPERFVATKVPRPTDKDIIDAYRTLRDNTTLRSQDIAAQLGLNAVVSTNQAQNKIQVAVDEIADWSTECSSISDDYVFDAARTIMTATRYVQHHIGTSFFDNQTSLPPNAKTPEVTLEEAEINHLATENGWPAWKTASIKHQSTMFELGGNNRLPLSLILAHPRRRRDSEVKRENPEYFYTYVEGWKKDSINNNVLILVEMVSGEPPECAVWEDGQEGTLLNGTKWLSVGKHGKPLYAYDKAQIFKTHVARVWPNTIYPESKRCAKDFILVLKRSNAEVSGRTEKSHPKGCFVSHFDGVQENLTDTEHFPKDTLVGSKHYRPQPTYDGASDQSKWPSWLSKYQDWSEEDASKLPVFERSNGEGIRVIYVTRDPSTKEPIPLVDYVQEEDERYPFVRDMIEKGSEGGTPADSLTVDCPQVGQEELRDRLNMAYDHLEERVAYLEGEGEIIPKRARPSAAKPTRDPSDRLATLLVGPKGPIPLDGAADGFEGGDSEYDSDIENVYESKDWSSPIRVAREAEGRAFANVTSLPPPMREYIDSSLMLARAYEQKGREYDAVSINTAYSDYLERRASGEKDTRLKVKEKEKKEAEGVLIKGLPKCPPSSPDRSASGSPSDSNSSGDSLLDTPVPHLSIGILDGNYSPKLVDNNVVFDDDIEPESCSVWGSSEGSDTDNELPSPPNEIWDSTQQPEKGVRSHKRSKESTWDEYAESIIEERCSQLQRLVNEQKEINRSILSSIESLQRKDDPEGVKLLELFTETEIARLTDTKSGPDILNDETSESDADWKLLTIINRELERFRYPAGVVTPSLASSPNDSSNTGAAENVASPITDNLPGYDLQPCGSIYDSSSTSSSVEDEDDMLTDYSDMEDCFGYSESRARKRNSSLANLVTFKKWDATRLERKAITQIVFTSKVKVDSKILDTIIQNKPLCQRLVYFEINNSPDNNNEEGSGIEDIKIRELVQLCPGLVGIALRGVPSITDETLEIILSRCKFICGVELSGNSNIPGKLSLKGLEALKRPRIACNLRELVILKNPDFDGIDAQDILKEYHPFLQLTYGTGGTVISYSAMFNPYYQDEADFENVSRWMLLEHCMTDEQMEELMEEELKAVEEEKGRYSVARVMEYFDKSGGFQFPLDEEQVYGAQRVNSW